MVERYRRPEPAPAPAPPRPARYVAPAAPEPTGPFAVGDYIEVNLTDTKVGSGYRSYLVIHVYPRLKQVRLFYPPTLESFDFDIATLGRNRTLRKFDDPLRKKRVGKSIRDRKREYKTFGMRITSDVDAAIAILRD